MPINFDASANKSSSNNGPKCAAASVTLGGAHGRGLLSRPSSGCAYWRDSEESMQPQARRLSAVRVLISPIVSLPPSGPALLLS